LLRLAISSGPLAQRMGAAFGEIATYHARSRKISLAQREASVKRFSTVGECFFLSAVK